MSDAIYGKGNRYVSRQRLRAMLDYEYDILTDRLSEPRGKESRFFSYCNTVRARGYKDTGECHGWMGIKFQLDPEGPASEILIHVRMLDVENVDQMEALGIVGTNLIYAAYFHREHLEQFVKSLLDGLTTERIEVDMLKFDGPGFEKVDNRICALELVRSGLTNAAMFRPDGEVVQPAEALYKRPILLLRGSFDPVLNLHLDMIRQARKIFCDQLSEEEGSRSLELCEISMNNLLREGEIDYVSFIDRAEALQKLGKTVLISDSAEFHRMATYLSRYTKLPIGIVLSIGLLNELFKEKWSANLPGGILESFGRLFKNQVKLLVYPWKNRRTEELVTADNFIVEETFEHLYSYLRENEKIVGIDVAGGTRLDMTSRDVIRLIEGGDESWKDFVPEEGYQVASHYDKS